MAATTSPLDLVQAKKAAASLTKYIEAKKKAGKAQLLEDTDYFDLQICLTKPMGEAKRIPVSIRVPNQFYDLESVDICVFTKDDQKEYRELFKKEFPNVKVIGLSKLRKNYKSYESKRKLVATYDLFFAQKAIMPLIPPMIGKAFYCRKKQPLPIDIEEGQIAETMENVLSSTRLFRGPSLVLSIKVGNSGQSADEIAANIAAVMDRVTTKYIPGWDTVHALALTATNTISLPLYNCLPTESAEPESAEAASDSDA